MALGGNYLDNIDNEDNNNNNNNSNNNGNNRWGIFGPGRGGSASSRGNNDNNQGRGGGGVGTAIRPPTPNSNYGIGANRRQQQQQPSSSNGGGGNGNGNGGVPRVFSIRQPQDLLDFVVEDERLSVGKSIIEREIFAVQCYIICVYDDFCRNFLGYIMLCFIWSRKCKTSPLTYIVLISCSSLPHIIHIYQYKLSNKHSQSICIVV